VTPLAVCGVQQHLSAIHSNVPLIGARLDALMSVYPWVQMVVFSELAGHGPLIRNAEPLPGPTEAAFCEMAAKHGIWFLPGSLFERSGDRIYNTAPVIDPHGNVVARYRKMFPFYPYEEDVTPGDSFCVFDVPGIGRCGVSICYDMWFPETSRTLAAMGAEVILHPTLTNSTDREIELAIARATAAQNQCFFVDINGLGDGGNGRSIIVGPHGDVLHQATTTEEWIPLELDFDRVRRSRATGVRNLGQPLKSFRDSTVDFTVYRRGPLAETDASYSYLDSLGPLVKPHRGSRAGLK
jgi:predicted amidohydrolase